MCVFVCVCVWWSVFAFLKHQFLGNSRRYAKFSLSSFLRLGHHRGQYTSLTVTCTTDADTVADYPTFVWLNSIINYIFSLLCCRRQSSFGFTRGENRLFRRAATSYIVRGQFFHNFQAIYVNIKLPKKRETAPYGCLGLNRHALCVLAYRSVAII